ncbi:MAG: hypothetical protein Q9219_000609 [cf. Caloplaca sp. 3 TL-2023]
MPAYHSIFLQDTDVRLIDHESYDPLDEILSLYRANTFFRNFEIKGPADRLLIYGILCVGEMLGKVPKAGAGGGGQREGEKALLNAALDSFAIPGDAAFPLNQAFEAPRDRQDAETLRQYVAKKNNKKESAPVQERE